MSTIDTTPSLDPDDAQDTSSREVRRITIYVHNLPPAAHPEPRPPQDHDRKERTRGKHRLRTRTRWLDLVEKALTSWPITLRIAVLLTILVTGTAATAAAVGIGAQLLLAAIERRAPAASTRPPARPRRRFSGSPPSR